MGTKRAEILAPAGSPEALQAALDAGADAVHLGLKSFNARGNAIISQPKTSPTLCLWRMSMAPRFI